MKVRSRRDRPFLVLPLIEVGEVKMTKKKSNLKLFTKAWPAKNDKEQKEERPLTATLEKPQILDIKFLGKIDMSLIRKEFLCIPNLCRVPLRIRRGNAINRPLSLPSCDDRLSIRHLENDEETQAQSARSLRLSKPSRKIVPPLNLTTKKVPDRKPKNDPNNNQKPKREVKRPVSQSTKLPQPCKTCGRPDQPERFHSHPATPLRPKKNAKDQKMEENVKIPIKSTVQKPVAIKYKSKGDKPAQKSPLPPRKLIHSPPRAGGDEGQVQERPRTGKGPRTLMCYLCGREFGTASLPLHEPKCLEKWQRENASLPPNLRRKPPKKPDCPMTPEKWNEYAWEVCQASLTPCENCGRTFLPDRLIVHQRSCKPQNGSAKSPSDNQVPSPITSPTSPTAPPASVECPLCGRMFGTKSIKIHEPQCRKKLQMQLEPVPSKKQPKAPAATQEPQPSQKPPSPKRPSMLPCYLCGRMFSASSLYIHEPQCLKKWKVENDKLPPSQRRPEPAKPDIVFKPDGKIDFDAMSDASWKSHINQLVPCNVCGRTFNPDRVDVHQRSCKG